MEVVEVVEVVEEFEAKVDRGLKHKYERQQRQRREVAASTKRVPLFEREDAETSDRDCTIEHHRASIENSALCTA